PDTFTPQEASFKVHLDAASQHQYRKYHSRDFCCFEFKDVLPDQPLQFSIETKDNYLWIFIQLLGSGKIAIVPTIYVADGQVECSQLRDLKRNIALAPWHHWFCLLGIALRHWLDRPTVSPLLQPIAGAARPEGISRSTQSGQTGVHSKVSVATDA